MTIGDVVTQLKYGELRSIATKDDNVAITSYINLALISLYSRFSLKMSEHLVTLVNNQTEYPLSPDTMTVYAIYNENGSEFTLDDESSLYGINQVDFETIQVSNPIEGNTISVIYKPSPIWLTYSTSADLTKAIPIPPQLFEPLLHYIGYRAHGSMNGDIKAENNTHLMRYEASVKRIKALGLVREVVPPAFVNKQESISDIPLTYVDSLVLNSKVL